MNKQRFYAIIIGLMFLAGCTYQPKITKEPAKQPVDAGGTITAIAQTIVAGLPTSTPQVEKPTENQATEVPATDEPTNTPIPVVIVATATPTAYVNNNTNYDYCYNAEYISDVTIEDGTEIYPGVVFKKTWKIYNSGYCTWRDSFYLDFVGGKRMGGESVELGDAVEPGDYVKISVYLTAPTKQGDWIGYWRMFTNHDAPFGDTLTVEIDSDDDADTPTPSKTTTVTVTKTPTVTPSRTSTTTSSVTSSVTPSMTSTATPTSTFTPTYTETPTMTPTPTETPTLTPSETPTGTLTDTPTPSNTPT
jgi:hypothetical protein